MTLVTRIKNGRRYLYDYHYLNGKTKTTYIGPVDRVRVVSRVKDNPRLSNSPCYKAAHKIANEAEIEEYGIDRFNQLNLEMRERIPPRGEFSGMNYPNRKLTASGRVRKKFYGQILFHERVENDEIAKLIKKGRKCF